MKKKIAPLLVGIVMIVFGGGYVVARLLGYDPPFFFDGWWTLLIIVPAIISMVDTGIHLGNTLVLVGGALLLAWRQGWIKNLNFTLVLAIVLVVLGVYFIIRAVAGGRPRPQNYGPKSGGDAKWRMDAGDIPSYSALFASTRVQNRSGNLMGGTFSGSFGRLRVDLSEAAVTHDITVFCNAIFGQVTVYPPRNVRVVCKNVPILGGVQILTANLPPDVPAPTIYFDCTTVVGGVNIQ